MFIQSVPDFQEILRGVSNRSGSPRFVAGCKYGELKDLGLEFRVGASGHVSVRCPKCVDALPRCHPDNESERECSLFVMTTMQASMSRRFFVALSTDDTKVIDDLLAVESP
jgi:hypothetical protein